jgi:hypothetical protein
MQQIINGAEMNRLSMSGSWVFRMMPVFIIGVLGITVFKEPQYWWVAVIFIAILVYEFFSPKPNKMYQLHDVYIDSEKILVKLRFSRKPKIEIPLNNAIRVDYTQSGQIFGQFWFYHPETSVKSFVYFWPTLAEAKCESSKLYTACIAAGYEREKSKNA